MSENMKNIFLIKLFAKQIKPNLKEMPLADQFDTSNLS